MRYENTGLVLQCNEAGIIQAVLFSTTDWDTSAWVTRSLFSLIDPATEEATLFLLESVKEFGHVEAWPLLLARSDDFVSFYCNAARFNNAFILTIYQSSGNIISLDAESQSAEIEITTENGPEKTNRSESEMLDELSRLNNELVNTKRELIKQNVKLKRLQNPWEEGLTFI